MHGRFQPVEVSDIFCEVTHICEGLRMLGFGFGDELSYRDVLWYQL